MIISFWAIIATIICIWFIATKRTGHSIAWLVLICIGIYTFLPIIMIVGFVMFLVWLFKQL